MSASAPSPSTVLEVFDTLAHPGTPMTTSEVAGGFDCTQRTIYNKLEILVEEGVLETKKVGARGRVWWRPLERTSDGPLESVREREERLRLVLEAANVGIWELDLRTEESSFRSVQYDRIFGLDEPLDDWCFERFVEHVHPDDRENVKRGFRDAFDGGEWAFECRIARADDEERWISVRGEFHHDDEGEPTRATCIVRDITDPKERERELERYKRIIDAVGEPVYELDERGRFTFVNDAFVERSGYRASELVGEHASIGMSEDAISRATTEILDLLADGGGGGVTLEYEVVTKGGERIPAENRLSLLVDDDGRFRGSVGVLWDISERVRRERELEESRNRYRTLVENFPNGAVALVDEDLRYVTVGGTPLEEAGATVADLLGSPLDEVLAPELADILVPRYAAALDGERSTLESAIGDRFYQFRILPVHNDSGDVFAAIGISQDITDQKERERELRARVTRERTVAALGTRAIEHPALDDLFDRAVHAVAETLDVEYCKVLELTPDGDHVFLRSGVGWRDGLVGEALVPTDLDSQAGYTLLSEEPVVVDDLRTETRFNGPELLTSHDVVSGISVVIGSVEEPWGVLGTHDTTHRSFTEHDVNFVRTVANILATAIERATYEAELEHQHEQLTALNDLNQVVQDVTQAVIDQSTRGEIERAVCDRLSASDSYLYAWIGHLDGHGRTVTPVVGGGDESLAEITLSLDEDPSSVGPSVEAARTREVRVTHDSHADPVFREWRDSHDVADCRGISIPITFEEQVYGVLNAYTDRAHAFDENEQRIVRQLGEVVGHAVNSLQRKRALLEDSVHEITMRSESLENAVGVGTDDDSVTISIDRTIPLPGGQTITYYTVDGLDPERFVDIVQEIGFTTDVRLVERVRSRSRVEVVTAEETLATTLVTFGGRIVEPILRDGELRIVVQVPQDTDLRQFKDTIRTVYPDMEFVAQTQVTREEQTIGETFVEPHEQLTERQRTALEVAYHAGFFNWPRDTTGQELAERLGVSASTLHHHLRHGEYKLMSAFLDAGKGQTPN